MHSASAHCGMIVYSKDIISTHYYDRKLRLYRLYTFVLLFCFHKNYRKNQSTDSWEKQSKKFGHFHKFHTSTFDFLKLKIHSLSKLHRLREVLKNLALSSKGKHQAFL